MAGAWIERFFVKRRAVRAASIAAAGQRYGVARVDGGGCLVSARPLRPGPDALLLETAIESRPKPRQSCTWHAGFEAPLGSLAYINLTRHDAA